MNSLNISEDNPQNNINNSNISIYGNNQIRNYSDNKAPTIKIPRDMPTKSLQIRKVVSNVLFGLGAAAAAVAIAAAVASLAFAVAFLPLAAIVGIGIASVALLTTGIILRLKKDTLSEENLPEVIKLLAEKNENYIKSNIGFVNKVIEFCGKNKVLAELFNKECDKDIKLLLEKSGNLKVDSSDELTKNLESINESIKKNYDLIQSISFLKEGENVYKTLQGEANFKEKALPLQENNDTGALNETVSFFENQENKNKLIELAENHTCGIMKYDAVIDNNGTISKFEKGPNGAFLSPKKENNVDKKSKDTENYDVNLNEIKDQSESDFKLPVTLIIENKETEYENLTSLKEKIKDKSSDLSNDSDEIIKKILSFPGQSSFDSFFFVQPFFNKKFNKQEDLPIISLQEQNIQYKIEIIKNDVYLSTSCKFTVKNNSTDSFEPICIEESKKYRLNDQKEGKYTVPTLLAEHIAVFEATPYVMPLSEEEKEEGHPPQLAYLKIGEKKSEFNWINPNQNPKPEELVTFDVVNNAVNNEKK